MYIGGLDIGTTGCKLTVFDDKGQQVKKAYCDYPHLSKTGTHEVDANAILSGVYTVIKKASEEYPDIAGIGVTSFGETFVMTDEKGTPLRNSMLYTDPRGNEQCKVLCDKLSPEKIADISGVEPHEMYSIPKIMWIKENEPEVYAKAKYIFLMEDFVIFHLTGIRKIDYSLATRTMAFDIRKLSFSDDILEAAGVEKNLFSDVVPTGTPAGKITTEKAEALGLNKDTVIVCISHDQIAAAVGAGVFDSDTAVDGAGTVECITPIYDEIPDMNVMTKGKYAVAPYVIPGKYVCYAFSYTGGALMQWCTETLAKKEIEIAKEKGISVNKYLEELSESPTGLLVLPHFAGAATPYMDNGSKGTIVGMTLDSSVADIYRGCMEGVVYEMVLNMDWLKDSGIHFTSLKATGGGAHSEVWMQMKADMLNMPITSLETVDAGTVGSAMLTGIAVGVFKDLEDATKVMVHPVKTYYPRENMHNEYMKHYERYSKLYLSVRELM